MFSAVAIISLMCRFNAGGAVGGEAGPVGVTRQCLTHDNAIRVFRRGSSIAAALCRVHSRVVKTLQCAPVCFNVLA